ncbi:hypothetical protein [Spongiactinospora sp. 9N601]|uniref:hypothetical protein n=1 Tax=Spongiactinospora sp. 9N601 TaxID=3375149 RepID=UPI00378944ED
MKRSLRTLLGAVAALVFTGTLLSAPANGQTKAILGCDWGTNHDVYVECVGGADRYSAVGRARNYFYGQIHLWGPNLDVWGPVGDWPSASGQGHNGGWVCAEGWRINPDGSRSSVGLPCVQVT